MDKLQKRNFWLFTVGRLVSLLGSGIQAIAIPLYILKTTGSGTMMGLFAFLSLLPALITAPFAGVLGDRWNRKKIMVNMDFARGVVILGLGVLALTNNMNIYILFACQVVISLMSSIFGASTQAMVPELVSKDDLMRANSTIASVNSVAMIAGPALGGIIFGLSGIKVVFLLNGISFILSAISEMFIKYVSTTKSEEKLSVAVVMEDFKEGFSFIRCNKLLLGVLVFFAATNLLINPAFTVIIPFAYREVIGFSDQLIGVLRSTFIIGFLVGNLALASIFAKKSSKKLIKIGLFGMVAFNALFTITLFPSSIVYFGGASKLLFIVFSIEFIIMGICNVLFNIPLQTNLQKLIPNKLRSRVMSVVLVITQAGVPLGSVVYGIMLDLVPVHSLYLGMSIVFTVLTIGFLILAPAGVYEPEKADLIIPEKFKEKVS